MSGTVERQAEQVSPARGFSFYDDLRRSPTATFRPVREPKPSVGRALHVASDLERLGGTDVTLCHVPIFLGYSMYDEEAQIFRDVSSLSYGGTAGALLAMHHFNNGDGSIVEELDGINERCKIRFTTEVIDTQSSSIAAVQQLASDITHRPKTDFVRPPACAVMGAALYTVSQSMATVTGVFDLLQVSPSSSSMSLDSSTNYPLFSRTHPSDEAKGRLAVEYFDRHLDIKHIGILFVNNEQGLSLQKTVLDAATERNMTVRSVSFPDDASAASLRNSLVQLKESGFNYFLGVFYPLPYDFVMEIAVDVGVAGPGKFWLVTGHLADAFAGGNITVTNGSSASIGTTGLGVLHDDAGLHNEAVPGLPQHEKFLHLWKNFQYDQEALDYINSKQPKSPEGTSMTFQRPGDYFRKHPSHYAEFSYDAIAGMGIAACRAASQSSQPDDYFSGKEHHKAFISNPFVGATGNVSFSPDSFSRDGSSVYNFVSEIQIIDRPTNRTAILSGKTSAYFGTKLHGWKPWPRAREFVYSGGSTTPPLELPPHTENTNSLSTAVITVCLILASVVMLTSLGLSVFVCAKRKCQVIISSQPPFLYMLCVGTIIMSSAIIPMTIDDSVASDAGCSIACVSRVWLASIGFTITFSALFSKTHRINKLMKMSRGCNNVELKAADVIVPFLIMLFINVLILSLWTAFAPLQWYRKPLQYDRFGRLVESVGVCYNEGWLPYGIALFCINGTALLLALAEAYKARKVPTLFSESKYIAAAVVCIFQALFFGAPLFFITMGWPTAQLFVLTAAIFITCMAVLLLIFVPKIRLLRKAPRMRPAPTGILRVGGDSIRHRSSISISLPSGGAAKSDIDINERLSQCSRRRSSNETADEGSTGHEIADDSRSSIGSTGQEIADGRHSSAADTKRPAVAHRVSFADNLWNATRCEEMQKQIQTLEQEIEALISSKCDTCRNADTNALSNEPYTQIKMGRTRVRYNPFP